jgi:hypothetical protein
MPVSTSRIREIRKQLEDAARDLSGDREFESLADTVESAAKAFSEAVDERGQLRDDPAPQVGARVKRPDGPADDAPLDADKRDVVDEPDSPDEPAARKRKLPPEFLRGRK